MINLINHYANGEKLYEKMVESVYRQYDLTYMEFSVVMFLYNNKEYDTAKDIIKYRHLTKSHVSSSINSLIEKGYLETHFLNKNRKTIHLNLTNSAISLAKKGQKAQIAYMNTITNGFSDEEIRLMKEFIKKIDENIERNLN